MQVPFDRILPVNLVASTVVFFTAARIYVLPRLGVWAFGRSCRRFSCCTLSVTSG